jgi:hypothetical protein
VTLVVRGTTERGLGVEDLTTLRTTTGLVTEEVHCVPVQGPVVIVAVFVTLVVSVEVTTASKVAFAESPAARWTFIVSVEPLAATAQVSPVATVAHAGVPASVTFDGSGSLTVAVPAVPPTFSTLSV